MLSSSDLTLLQMLDPGLALGVAREICRDELGGDEYAPWRHEVFEAQQSFIGDPAPRVLALCSRRAGKSEGLARRFLDVALRMPGEISVYIAVSKPLARMILWAALEVLNAKYRLGLTFTERDGQLNVIHPNGHRIWLAGCSVRAECGKFRGPKYALAVIDEAQNYPPWVESLVEDVLDPACLDLQAQIVIAGTPGPITSGYFFDASTGAAPGWSVHAWDVTVNPYMPHAATWLAAKRAANGWTDEHPTYLREWRGQWVMDTGALVYPYDAEINGVTELPADRPWLYGLGLDFGFSAPSAFVVVAYSPGHPEVYVVEAWARTGMIPARIAAEVARLDARYHFVAKVGDGGGLGVGYIAELASTHNIDLDAAQKTHKRAYQELMRGELRSGQIRVLDGPCSQLLDEWRLLQWADDTQTAEHEGSANHCADAALYITRKLRPHYDPIANTPRPGTPEAEQAWMDEFKARSAARVRSKLERRK